MASVVKGAKTPEPSAEHLPLWSMSVLLDGKDSKHFTMIVHAFQCEQ